MFRYVAFVWNPSDRAAADCYKSLSHTLRVAPWRAALESTGLAVFCAGEARSPNTALPLAGCGGVVLGTLFERGRSRSECYARATIDATTAARIVASHGRELIERYWGRYVAFLRDPASNTRWILRDPGGELECLTVQYCDVSLFFSFMEDCPPLRDLSFSINWAQLAAVISVPTSSTRETSLNEISRILPGECLELSAAKSSRTFYWHPFEIVASGRIDDPAQAAAQLHETTRACIHSWASCYPRILNLLSGGLDSSIIAGCLASAPSRPAVTNQTTYYAAGSGSDERYFARQAARHAGYPLLEQEMDADINAREICEIPRTAAAISNLIELGILGQRRRAYQELDITGVFLGTGGDQLFFQYGCHFAGPDYIFERGLRPALFRVALDAARMENDVVWSLLFKGMRQAFFRPPLAPLIDDLTVSDMLTSSASELVERRRLALHPWFESQRRIAPGKIRQIFGLSTPYGISGSFARPEDPEDVHPLLSQPLLELCYRIPTYVLASGGIDRSLARQAFAAEVPPAILRRRVKGETVLYPKALYDKNRAFVREMLLSGALVREKILDREHLERVLADSPDPSVHSAPGQLLSLASVEAWLQMWLRPRQQAAA